MLKNDINCDRKLLDAPLRLSPSHTVRNDKHN